MLKFNVLPKTAVCLAAFNGVQWLPEQLDSILAQTDISLTVFVSVDSSSDGTEEWIDARAVCDSRIIVLSHGEHFGGAARNFFRILRDVDFTEFDYVCFADQDDIWLPDKLNRACKMLLKTGAHAYSSNVIALWPNGRRRLIEKSQPQKRWDFLFEAAGPGCTYVITSELMQTVQSTVRARWIELQEVALHDWFIYAYARANRYLWVIDEYAGMLYRQHAGNQVGANKGWRAFVHRAGKVLDGWGLQQSALIARLVGLSDLPLVRRGLCSGRAGLFWLAMQSWQCRRRACDKLIFTISCVVLGVIGRVPR